MRTGYEAPHRVTFSNLSTTSFLLDSNILLSTCSQTSSIYILSSASEIMFLTHIHKKQRATL